MIRKLLIISILPMFFATFSYAQKIVGHRGSIWGVENTRAAFINGAKAGAWGLECDIHTTKDGVFVVCHDGSMRRLGGPATPFSKMNVAEVLATPLLEERKGITYAGHLMTLGEYLDLCHELNVVPVIEIKEEECLNIHYAGLRAEAEPAVAQAIAQTEKTDYSGVPALLNMLEQRNLLDKAVIISFMPGVIDYLHKTYPKLKVQVLVEKDEKTNDEWIQWCTSRGIDLDIHWPRLNKEMVERLHKAGLRVNVWTVDSPEVFERMQGYGVDFVTTNVLFPVELK